MITPGMGAYAKVGAEKRNARFSPGRTPQRSAHLYRLFGLLRARDARAATEGVRTRPFASTTPPKKIAAAEAAHASAA